MIEARHTQGLAAYRAGHTFKHAIEVANEIEQMHRAEGVTPEEHEEISASIPSFLSGFADGFLDDIRTIAKAHRGLRA
jgi:hypothetical protein